MVRFFCEAYLESIIVASCVDCAALARRLHAVAFAVDAARVRIAHLTLD